MIAGQYVVRGDGSTWQITAVTVTAVPSKYGNNHSPVPVSLFHLRRGGEIDYVRQWGREAAALIGRDPQETLRLAHEEGT